MKRVILLLLIIKSASLFPIDKIITLKVTEKEQDRIVVALRVVAALKSGNYAMKAISSIISDGRNILRLEMLVAGQRFRIVQSFPVQTRPEKKNMIQLFGGGIWGVQYGRKIIGSLWLTAGPAMRKEEALVFGGVTFFFGK